MLRIKFCFSLVFLFQDFTMLYNSLSFNRPKPFLFKGDHRFSSANLDAPVVILYAELGTKEFARFHQHMMAKANKGLINYILRHYISVSTLYLLVRDGYLYMTQMCNHSYITCSISATLHCSSWIVPTNLFVLQKPSDNKVFLSGYGVELAIKNQEYKAKDDTQVQGLILFLVHVLGQHSVMVKMS